MKPLEIHVPTGIGDFSWIYSKLVNCGRSLAVTIPDSRPLRTKPFCDLLPGIASCNYVHRKFPDPKLETMHAADFGISTFPLVDEPINIWANKHVEHGHRIEEWLTDELPVSHHYPINTQSGQARCHELLGKWAGPLVMIYTSDKQKDRISGWRLWTVEDWLEVAVTLHVLTQCQFVVIGADYDRDKTTAVWAGIHKAKIPARLMLNEPLAAVLEAMRRCCYVLAFPSGIGIIADVLDVPCMMMMPRSLPANMAGAWGDPANLATERYKVWRDPKPAEFLEWFSACGVVHFHNQRETLRRATRGAYI